MRPVLAVLLIVVATFASGRIAAQEGEAGREPDTSSEAVADQSEDDTVFIHAEDVTVTASRTPEPVRDAPVAVTVLRGDEIAGSGTDNVADLLRRVPGVNVIQMSARDVNLTPRTATGVTSRTTLALLDGQPLTQDYFGMVLWDLVPTDFGELERIEVIRGPDSALWGANALTGVVNLITKRPRDMVGTSGRLAGGELGTFEAGLLHAAADDRLSYKVSGSYREQDAFDRPTALPDGTPLPPYDNRGTEQTKLSARLDRDGDGPGSWRLVGGWVDSGGVFVTFTGPFDATTLQQGYAQFHYDRQEFSLSAYFSTHDAEFEGLLAPDAVAIDSRTLQLDARHSRMLGERHELQYGASVRVSDFDMTIVPDEDSREEAGAYLEGRFSLGARLRLRLGGRLDWFSTFGTTVSPRVGLIWEPHVQHTLRAGYNRAYIAPSLVENFVRTTGVGIAPLPTGDFAFPFDILGNLDLDEETIDAFEIGYTGLLANRYTVTASLFRNETEGLINFLPALLYTPANPPPGWPLPPALLELIPLPRAFQNINIGRLVEEGLELSLDAFLPRGWTVRASYSYQDEPDLSGPGDAPAPFQVNIPPSHRYSLGAGLSRGPIDADLNASWTDEAFFADVLTFSGGTEDYLQIDGSVSMALPGDRATVTVRAVNLTDETIQSHIFGDLITRRLVAELRFDF